MLLSHIAIGCKCKMYPVNKKGGSIAGMTIYPSIEDIPDTIDFAIIAVPAHLVPSAVEACRANVVVGVEILSSGFREAGTPEGIALEEELQAIAKHGVRVIGPNCFRNLLSEIGAYHAAGAGSVKKIRRCGAAFAKRRPFGGFCSHRQVERNKLFQGCQLWKRLRSQGDGNVAVSSAGFRNKSDLHVHRGRQRRARISFRPEGNGQRETCHSDKGWSLRFGKQSRSQPYGIARRTESYLGSCAETV